MDLWNMVVGLQQQLNAKDAQLTELRKDKDTQLNAKDAQLNAKDAQLTAKDAQLNAKDNQLTETRAELDALNKQFTELRVIHGTTKDDLKNAIDELLSFKGQRNIRGALEYAAKTVRLDCVGISPRLVAMKKDASFATALAVQARRFHVELSRVQDCLETIYDRLCQNMHGSEETVYLRYADVTAPVQRAVLHAVFDHKNIKYIAIDENGKAVPPYVPPKVDTAKKANAWAKPLTK
jgi:hypothetical protein